MPSTKYSVVKDGHKLCSKCDNLLPVSSFRSSKHISGGYRSECKACSKKAEERRRRDRAAGIFGTTGRPRIVLDKDGKKLCTICKRNLHASKFSPSTVSSTGLDSRCVECNVKRTQARHNQDLKYALSSAAIAHKKFLLNGSKRRLAWLADSCVCTEVLYQLWKQQSGKCAVTGLAMTHIRGKGRVATNLSIDRINNDVGYTRDNIRLVCRQVNVMKHDLSDSELVAWCKIICDSDNAFAKDTL